MRRSAQGKIVILEIDVQGGGQVRAIYPDAVMVFILAPTPKDLADRLHGRKRDDVETAKRRLEQAGNEIAQAWQDYKHFVINENVNDAVDEIIRIIETAGTDSKMVREKRG